MSKSGHSGTVTAPSAPTCPAPAPIDSMHSDALSTLLHLEQRLLTAQTPDALGFIVANETLALVGYRQAAVFKAQPNGRYRLSTASGLVSVAEDSPFAVWINRFAATFPPGSRT